VTNEEYIQKLEDAVDNFLGILDTPLARRRRVFGDLRDDMVKFAKEVRRLERPEVRIQDVQLSVKQDKQAREAGLL
jgi:hypothetical protein